MKFSSRVLATVVAAGLATAGGLQSTTTPAHAAAINSLLGKWTIVLGGNTGCGSTSLYVTVTLNGAGTGSATVLGHSTGCANSNTTETFSVLSLAPDGQGTASLTCGVGCGWQFKIQVGRSGNEMILANVEPTNPNNTPVGMGLRQFP